MPRKTNLWTGPAQVVEVISDHVYKVKCLDGSEATRTVHASRLKYYNDRSLNFTADLINRIKMYKKFEIESILDLALMQDGVYYYKIEWLGFEEEDDMTWEPLKTMFEDCPLIVRSFFAKTTLPSGFIRKVFFSAYLLFLLPVIVALSREFFVLEEQFSSSPCSPLQGLSLLHSLALWLVFLLISYLLAGNSNTILMLSLYYHCLFNS